MLRTVARWFSTQETKDLAKDVDTAVEKMEDLMLRLRSLEQRVDRHLNKLRMRDAREQRTEGRFSEEEMQVIEELRRRGGDDGLDHGLRIPGYNIPQDQDLR